MSANKQVNILLVDDEPANLLALEAVLDDLGEHLVRAGSGEEALAKAADTDFAAILLDVRMPTMSGFEAARRMRAMDRCRNTPIIFVTAYDMADLQVEEAYALGAVDFLAKPLVPAVLKAKLSFFVELFVSKAALRMERAVDLRERLRAEADLQASEERYRTVFNSMDEGFCIIEMLFNDAGRPVDYRFIETNRAFVDHTGLVDAVGRTVRELLPAHESHWFETYGAVVSTGRAVRFVNEAKGLGRWYDVHASRIGGAETRQVAVLFNDITPRKRAEDELRRLASELAEADRNKSEFLATLGHELRNPLAPLRNGLHVIRLAHDDPAAVAKALDIMERQFGRLVLLVDDLLDIARISSGKLELKKQRVELKSVLASAVETSQPLIEAGRHELRLLLPDEPIELDADPARLAQVIVNLLSNAAKYTPEGGCIQVRAQRDGGEVSISVADDGIGIAADWLPRLFEIFSQADRDTERRQGGLGIGLSLVRRLVELHGGTVAAASPGLGEGSTFTVRLPLAPLEPPHDEGESELVCQAVRANS
ncbi:MAG TPA: ATP-binding protein [Albitalea sp.]